MRNRTRNMQEQIYPVTEEDWRDARHNEDPADRRDPENVERAFGELVEEAIPALNTLAHYKKR